MSRLPALNELEGAAEMIDDSLPAGRIPPLRSEVVFPAGHNDPERQSRIQSEVRRKLLLFLCQMNIAVELPHRERNIELLFEVLGVAVDELQRAGVALMNQRVFTFTTRDSSQSAQETAGMGKTVFDTSAGSSCRHTGEAGSTVRARMAESR